MNIQNVNVEEFVPQVEVQYVAPSEQTRLAGLGIDIEGLGVEAIARIEEVGFDAWLDTAEDKLPAKTTAIAMDPKFKDQKERPIRRLLCSKCGEVFLSHTRATKKCPPCGGVTDILQENGKALRPCASGNKCLKAGKRDLPAPAAPGKQFCSDNCKGSHNARQQRIKAGRIN